MKRSSYRQSDWLSHHDNLMARMSMVYASHPVPATLRVTYNSFVLQVDKAQRNGLHGQELINYCRGLVSAYLEKRLEREVMEFILAQMFSVEPRHVRPVGYEAGNDQGPMSND